MNQLKNNSGQLTVGLAFAFAGILAMFALVFNSSLNTREKMKLQTTSDYASLVAANVQRYNLNFIRDTNKSIETEWIALSAALQLPYCYTLVILPCLGSSAGSIACVETAVDAFLGANASTPKKVKPDAPSGLCDQACDQYNNKIQDQLIQAYETLQTELASSIVTANDEADGLAFDLALDTFLTPQNLPQNLFMEMENSLGKGFSVADARNEYEKGGLTTQEYAYQILDENKNDPLFIAQQEYKLTAHFDYNHPDTVNPVDQSITCIGTAGSIQSPNVNYLPYRITRATDDTTFFYTGIRYMPPANLMEKMLLLGVKNPDNQNEKFGQDIENTEGNLPLFSRKTKEIQAVSAAKPYGGTFPESGVGGYGGTSGEAFKGAKLFGIADGQEIGDLRVNRADACIDQMDDEGNIMGSVCYKAEDFLH